MKLNDLLYKESEWLKAEGPKSNVAISTRVRVARNVAGHLYFNRANSAARAETLEMMIKAIKKSKLLKKTLLVKINDISNLDKRFLVERHLMSREHTQNSEFKALAIEESEIVSVMLNEEDHLRLQVMQSGFNVMETWRIVDEIDTELERILHFDYSDKFGYLTSCPTNTGTGMRASVMLHLPILAMTAQIENVFNAISKLGLTMRGFYGEDTEASGDFFQISNQVALGHSEMDVLDNLERIIRKIIHKEESARGELFQKRKEELIDRVHRSYGTLKNARIITSSETIKLLSAIRLGVDLGLLKDITISDVNEVLLLTQPAHLQKINGEEIAPYDRDLKRADLIRQKLVK
ncbi:MAG: protein arginine kinase [Candidatus Omnitrophica bacterium]|nr:protein arginine kinase [Candidatus Omnitrophota bacterium]